MECKQLSENQVADEVTHGEPPPRPADGDEVGRDGAEEHMGGDAANTQGLEPRCGNTAAQMWGRGLGLREIPSHLTGATSPV